MGLYKAISSGNGKSQPRPKETSIYKSSSSYKPVSSYKTPRKTKSSYNTSSYKQSRRYTTRNTPTRQTASHRSSSKTSSARRNNSDIFELKGKDVIICAGALGILVLWFVLSLFLALIILSVSDNGVGEGLSFILGAIISTGFFFALFYCTKKINLAKKNINDETVVKGNVLGSVMTPNDRFGQEKQCLKSNDRLLQIKKDL